MKSLKIMGVELYKFSIPLKYKTVVRIGVIENVENVLVKIITNGGIYGWGEASPFGPITGGTQHSNFEVGKHLAKVVLGKNPIDIESRMAEINRAIVHESSIRSAFDMALYDILGKAANLPLYALLGGGVREMRTDETIGMHTASVSN